jgi:hypothetical protein
MTARGTTIERLLARLSTTIERRATGLRCTPWAHETHHTQELSR